MGKNKGYKALCTLMTCIVIFFALQVTLFVFAFKPLKYAAAGEKYSAVVTVVGTEDSKSYVEAMYQDADGNYHYKEVFTYGRPDPGENFTAYVLDGEPKIFRVPDWWIVAAFFGGYALLMLISVIAAVSAWRTRRDISQLSRYGKTVTGEVITVTRKREFCYDCNVSFRDSEGSLQTAFVRFTRTVPKEGGQCTLIYHITKNNKLLCETIEL